MKNQEVKGQNVDNQQVSANYRNGRTAKEVLTFAREKAKRLNNRQLIRIFADDNFDYYLINMGGVVFIGSYVSSTFDKEMNPFFKKRQIWYTNEGPQQMKLQKLN